MGQLVNVRVFGKNDKPTIYYVVGFRMKIAKFRLPISVLSRQGFRVVAFDIDPSVLTAGDPTVLGKALDELMAIVQKDLAGRRVAGAYGISLGSFFAMNILTLPEVDKAFLNTGGGSIVQAVWEMPVLDPIKQTFIKNGYDRADVEKYWNPIDVSQNISRIKGKQLHANASYADEYIPIKDVLRLKEEWPAQGVQARIFTYKRFHHAGLIIRTLLKFRQTARFFNRGF
jgi:hypothetical protein